MESEAFREKKQILRKLMMIAKYGKISVWKNINLKQPNAEQTIESPAVEESDSPQDQVRNIQGETANVSHQNLGQKLRYDFKIFEKMKKKIQLIPDQPSPIESSDTVSSPNQIHL